MVKENKSLVVFFHHLFVSLQAVCLAVLFVRLLVRLLFPEEMEEVAQVVEILLDHDAHSLGGEAGFCEVAVVSLAIGFEDKVAVLCEQPLQVEVANEIAGCNGIVTIAEVTVYE